MKKSKLLNDLYVKYKWRERRINKGQENSDKIFYIIRRPTGTIGLFSYVMTNVGLIKYALDKGYIPIVDMQNYENTYLEKNEVGKKNSWEYYFMQPCGYTLEDTANSRNIILSGIETVWQSGYPGYDMVVDVEARKKWHNLFSQYVIVKPEIMLEAEQIFNKESKGNKVLGILCRGTDYVNLKPKDHPVQPSVDQIIEKARMVINEKKCARVYLATEDEKVYQQFRSEFGEKLWVTDSKRYSDTEKVILSETKEFKKTNKYENGKNYLLNILLLTKCDCLVAGCVGGTYGTLLMKEGNYEYEYIFKLGFYE